MKTKKPITLRDVYGKDFVAVTDNVIMSDQLGRIEFLLAQILEALRDEFRRPL